MTKADPSPSHRQSPAGAAADRHDEYSEQILSPPFSGGPCPLEPAASMCSGGAKLSQPGGVHISAVSALRSQSQDGDCQADPAGEGNEPNSTWRRMSGLNISAEPPYGDVTVPQSPTGGQSSPIRQPAHWPPRSPATAGGARKRTSPKKSVSPPKKAGAWSPIRGRHSRRPPPLLLSPRSSTTDKGMARGSTEGEKALQEWQRAMKSPSPSKWRASDAVMQLEADTIALAAGAVTAMLAANAAAAGPLDSPKKVVRRTWDWLAEQPEDAAELAVLLFEAAPKLKISASGSGGTSRPPKASRRASYKEEDGSRHRLSAAVPCPTGPGDIDWKQLAMVIGSESLKFEAEHNAASKAGQPGADDASHMFASPRGGDLVEVNSGGHVMFCFLSGPRSRNHHHGSDHAPCQPQQSASQSSPAAEQQQHRSGTQQQQSPQQSQPGSANKLTEARGHAAVGQRAGSETGEQLSAAPQLLDTLLEAPLSEQPPLPPHREAHRPPESCTGPAQGDALDCNANKDQSQPSGSLPGGTEGSTGAGAGRSPGAACSGRSSPCSSIRGGSRSPSPASSEHAPERVVIVKVHQARLASQSEQFANELTQHLGICTPACRILRRMGATAGEWKEAHEAAMPLGRRGKDQKESQTLRNTLLKAACDDKGATAGEWKEAHGAAMLLGRRGADLEEQMARSPCMLVMEYIPGRGLFQLQEPFQPPQILRTAEDLGRLFLLDMLLGNADRLPCEALGWRGNPHNVLFCDSGVHAGRMVAIDSAVQRRPPGGKMWLEDAACNKLAELALNDVGVAGSILREAVSCSPFAVRSVDSPDVHKAFQQGLLTSLQATLHIKGLLEMMFDVLSGWIDEFISDMEDVETTTEVPGTPPGTRPTTPPSASPGPTVHITPPPIPSHITPGGTRWGASSPRTSISTTQKIRSIGREARVNELISERLDHWKAAMRERGEELRAAVEEWQAKRASCSGAPRLTTGFLDGTCPIVDAYELKVRLEHMLQRLRVLQDAAATARPTRLLRHLWVGGAVEANSLHLLRHLGVTHLLNATEDLLLPDPATAFQTLRCSMRDMEEEDIGRFFAAAAAFIEEARSSGGAALVHCHEGKSRSVTLVLAYFMQAMDWTLKQALDFVTAARPQVSPNAGFMARLIRLEESLHGTKTVKLKKTKPEPRVCPVCSEKVGISLQSLSVHIRTKHNDVAAEYELMLRTCDSPK